MGKFNLQLPKFSEAYDAKALRSAMRQIEDMFSRITESSTSVVVGPPGEDSGVAGGYDSGDFFVAPPGGSADSRSAAGPSIARTFLLMGA